MSKIWDTKFPVTTYFKSEELTILATCASWPNIEKVFARTKEIIDTKKQNIFFITMDWSPTYQETASAWERFLPYKNFVLFMSNDEQTHKSRLSIGLKSFLINHNTWINESVFQYQPAEKKYDAIYTARAKDWKRIGLASKVRNLALIINRWNIESHRGENDYTFEKIPYSFLNDRKLDKFEIAAMYNLSKVGLLLSNYEGASYTSSEYLLCGIPVVSTKPEVGNGLGGREFWYNENNSIFCSPDENSVLEAVNALIEKNIDPITIRSQHIERMKAQRQHFLNYLLTPIFAKYMPEFDVSSFFYETLFNPQTRECILKSEGKAKTYDQIDSIF